jgi:hypothetical protein
MWLMTVSTTSGGSKMNNLVSRCRFPAAAFPPIIALIFAILLLHLSAGVFLAQSTAGRNQSSKATKQASEDPEIVRWKIFLNGLAQESRTVFPEERRPYAIVEVANANWEIDRDASRQLYFSALDMAMSLARQDKKYRALINYVLSAATRRDAELAEELNKRLLDKEDDNDNVSIETALEMLEENPLAAAQLAEAFAPNGLQDGTAAFLIFSLAKKDIRLSDRVYGVYLSKVRANESIELESVLTLAGYAFGYSEYYSVNKKGHLRGSSFLPISGLSANPVFTNAFLSLAARRLALAIDRRNRAVGGEIEGLNFPILFASEYLIPEVAKYAPGLLPSWQELQQRGIVGTTTQQTQQVQNHLIQIRQARLRTQKFSDNSQTPELEAEASLENVEKLPGTCQRDVIYSKAALLFASRKNFKRAIETAGKIEDLKQSENVKDAIAISVTEVAIENGEFEEAETKAGKISSPEHKARLYLILAQALISRNDAQQTQGVVNETIKLIEKLPDAGDRAAMLFSMSTILLQTDPQEAHAALRNAVNNLNKKEPVDQVTFEFPIKVPLSCPGEEVIWYGGVETVPNSNVFDALSLFARQNPDEATRAAEEIGDKINRIRALALITKGALKNVVARSKRKSNPNGN